MSTTITTRLDEPRGAENTSPGLARIVRLPKMPAGVASAFGTCSGLPSRSSSLLRADTGAVQCCRAI
jgi:hypothetical protein